MKNFDMLQVRSKKHVCSQLLRCGRVAAEFDLGLSLTSKRIMSISLGSGMFFTTPLSLHKHKILPGFMLGLARAQSYFGNNNDSTLAT